MACLSCTSISMPKAVAHPLASLTDNPSPPQEVKSNPKPRTTTRPRKRRQRLHKQKPQPPSIIQIERAIGAGSFRDADSSSDLENRRRTVFDGLLPITGGKFEGEIEKKLRETGEWIGSRTEATFRSSGKKNSVGRASMVPTNLGLFSPSGFWSYKATIQHTSD
ncbi:Chlororespiratory reduction 3, putative isoform 2 [Theobroma cacao]|uniref:Chlororespiratory reduction 3, putative isoform 2 n=1 Tax=Theobroma cacao TaxID=3641 RepID=A0A061E8R6_THECC|nr:Chlororespiratory reduction 3, putative isoform 2 [Theobroma cacao]